MASYTVKEPEFIEGIEFLSDKELLMSSGLNGESFLTTLSLDEQTGTISKVKSTAISSEYFGEGSTYFKGDIYYMTYREGVYFVFNRNLQRIG